ncbi:DUF2071 domain-containing protein [Bacillus stercoris]|nr:DUF2071 domain-containing protein [Bacillus stercoris]
MTERYRLYTAYRNKLYYEDIHHHPWLLQNAEAEISVNTVTDAHGITLPEADPCFITLKNRTCYFGRLENGAKKTRCGKSHSGFLFYFAASSIMATTISAVLTSSSIGIFSFFV